MSVTAQQTRSAITLKGSAKLVTDYLKYGINSILYQRCIYPSESFTDEVHFGITVFVSTDEKINAFLDSVLGQIKEWLLAEKIKKISLVISNVSTKEVVESWDFSLEYEKPKGGDPNDPVGNKCLELIQSEIRYVLRQICATVSSLPLLDGPCSFDMLIYTVPDADVPKEWGETSPCFIANPQHFHLRSFSTSLHQMNTVVTYKLTQ